MELFDTHAHIDDPQLAQQTADVIARARSAGVRYLMAIGTTVESSRRCQQLAATHVDLWSSAGIHPNHVAEAQPGDWDAIVATNLTGVFLCTRQAFALMKRQVPRGGRIINNGSLSAHMPRPRSAPYTATKHAVTGLTKSASLDGRPFDIACGQIDIGNADTEMTNPMKTTGVIQADGSTAREPTIDVDHVARAVVYMATLPLEANVQFMTVMATKMPFVGRG